MNGAQAGLAISVFLASAVEVVEAFTIVLAVGSARRWSSALAGVGATLAALAVIVAVAGPALVGIPIDVLRLLVGGLLLIFGLQWLRKAILRAAGAKALHDELAIFAEERAAASLAPPATRFDSYAFANRAEALDPLQAGGWSRDGRRFAPSSRRAPTARG
jgi:uncharacterized membrane protein